MNKLSDILLPATAEAVAYDVADRLRQGGCDFNLATARGRLDVIAYLKGYDPTLFMALNEVPPEDRLRVFEKARRLLEDGRGEKRRELWAKAWSFLSVWLVALGLLLGAYAVLAACELVGLALLGPGGPK